MIDSKEIFIKLRAARARLVLERPFIGTLVMHLPLRAADAAWCETVACDARAFYFNPGYVAGLTLAETQFVLAHEAMHCALGHFARRGRRDARRWDVAADYAVNQLLCDEGLRPAPGALLDAAFRGLSAEEIYPLIPADTTAHALDRHLFDGMEPAASAGSAGTAAREAARVEGGGGAGAAADDDAWDDAGAARRTRPARPPPCAPSPGQRAALVRDWRGRLAAAAQQARRAGRFDDAASRLVDAQLEPRLPWRQLLARHLVRLAREDYSFQRPSRRGGAALLPSLASSEVDLVIALDTSGSVGDAELGQFTAEVDALKGQVRARVTVLACDERLDARGPWTFEPWQPIALPRRLGGGGGTRFGPVFEWVAQQRRRPDLLLYFTDAEGEFPQAAPGYPVLWLVKGRAPVPWGERIPLN